MFERPTKGDIDRALSMLMHDAHHEVRAERSRIISEAAARGVAQSTMVIGTVAAAADKIHAAAIKQATPMLRAFVERMELAPSEIVSWARPHLENLSNTLLAQIPPAGFPAEHQRVLAQYRLVLQQRIDGALRDVEIGFVRGAGFSDRQPKSASAAPQRKEIMSLKPTIYGLGIDLKELWRWLRRRIKGDGT